MRHGPLLLLTAIAVWSVGVAGQPRPAGQVQGDVTCDGRVDLHDAQAVKAFHKGQDDAGACMFAGDTNCDGSVDFADAIALFRYQRGPRHPPRRPERPAPDSGDRCVPIGEVLPSGGPEITADMPPEVSISAQLDVRQDCDSEQTHAIAVQWSIAHATQPAEVRILVLPSLGPAFEHVTPDLEGSHPFLLSLPQGGHATVVVSVESPEGSFSRHFAVELVPCSIVAIPLPGEGFGPGDLTLPDGSGENGELREVDVAHLGGTPTGPVRPIVVTAVGTGSAIQLSSWSVGFGPPAHLADAPALTGDRVALHVLSPELSPKLEVEMLVAAFVDGDDLWLTTWSVDALGNFTLQATLGYGSNAGFDVSGFAIAHRDLGFDNGGPFRFQVVTPVVGSSTMPGAPPSSLRFVTWGVDESGAIFGLQDSGDWGDTAGSPVLDVAHQGDTFYAVSYKNANDALANSHWSVTSAGFPSLRGAAESGLDIRGTNTVVQPNLNGVALEGLTADGFITASRLDTAAPPTMISWETRLVGCDGDCFFRPFKIAAEDEDTDPGLGVDLGADPVLTDARSLEAATSDGFGDRLATGDFNGDGFEDLAIGVPKENAHGIEDSGQVDVMYGSAEGFAGTAADQRWTQESNGVPGIANVNDLFGDTVAAGDFDGDGFDDLAIGISREDVGGVADAGAVLVLHGSAGGLTSVGAQFWHRDSPGFDLEPGESDLFGEALAAGDFDGDGFEDLAIGIPFQNLAGADQGGAVEVLYGSAGVGLTTAGFQRWHQDIPGIIGDAEPDDILGKPLVAGDFDGDGRDDLAVGVRLEDVGAISSAGSLHVIYGTAAGLSSTDNQLWNLDNMGTADGAEAFDFFPTALAAGDFDGDSRDELAIGVPDQDRPGEDGAGAVYVLAGSADGLTAAGVQTWDHDEPAFGAAVAASEAFGRTLAAGDFNGAGPEDLALGIPGFDTGDASDVGAVRVLYGSAGVGLVSLVHQKFVQGEDDLPGIPEDGDFFGAPLAAGDYDGDGFADLAAAATDESVSSQFGGSQIQGAGALTVLYGSAFPDLLQAEGAQVWTQGIARRIRAILSDALPEGIFGIGGGELHSRFPAGEPLQAHQASVTKVMTLLLTVEAIGDGIVSLDDEVPITANAAGTGGSKMGPGPDEDELLEGDVMPLDLLLHGMMLRSGNRASVAIAEHVARTMFGEQATEEDPTIDMDNFVAVMNDRAEDLGMADTLHSHPAGGSITTPQDQVTLWLHGVELPLFRQIGSALLFDGCGVDALGEEKCYFLEKLSSSGYPGLGGWKGGNGRVGDHPVDENGDPIVLPSCVSCVVAEADRLTRKLVVAFQQSGDRWGDVDRLFDWGYKTLFTPDLRVQQPNAEIRVRDFGVDTVSDMLSNTAVIDFAGDLRICTWETLADAGAIGPIGCTTRSVDDLPPGPIDDIRATLIDIALMSTLDVEGDFITGHAIPSGIDLFNVDLRIWRVGPLEP